MAKLRKEKEAMVSMLVEKLGNAQSSILADYRGLTVAEVNDLRRRLREANIEFKVAKNTLTKIAAKEIGLEDMDQYLEGPTAIAFGSEDPAAPAKILSQFAKEHKKLEIKAGILEGKVISLERVKVLADLPSREQLLAQVANTMQAPISNLVNVLQAPIRNLAMVVEGLRSQREPEA